MRRLWLRLRYGPQCGQQPPRRLADAHPCIIRAHVRAHVGVHGEWHADGMGYVWNQDRWQWNGPVVNVEDLYGHMLGRGDTKVEFHHEPDLP